MNQRCYTCKEVVFIIDFCAKFNKFFITAQISWRFAASEQQTQYVFTKISHNIILRYLLGYISSGC